MDEEELEERIQFVNFTVSYTFTGDSVAGSIDYLETLDLSSNTSISLTNLTITKSEVPTSIPPEESPEYANDFVFTFSGFYGEEVAPNDTYRTREGNQLKVFNNFNNLPDFSKPDTYLIEFLPDPRESVTLKHFFTSNTGSQSTSNVVVTLDSSRHLTRITAIKETLAARSEQEKIAILRRVQTEIQLNDED